MHPFVAVLECYIQHDVHYPPFNNCFKKIVRSSNSKNTINITTIVIENVAQPSQNRILRSYLISS